MIFEYECAFKRTTTSNFSKYIDCVFPVTRIFYPFLTSHKPRLQMHHQSCSGNLKTLQLSYKPCPYLPPLCSLVNTRVTNRIISNMVVQEKHKDLRAATTSRAQLGDFPTLPSTPSAFAQHKRSKPHTPNEEVKHLLTTW